MMRRQTIICQNHDSYDFTDRSNIPNSTNPTNPIISTNPTNSNSANFRIRIIQGYADLFQRYIDQSWKAYIITFMFNSLPGGKQALFNQFNQEVTRVYSNFVTRVVRNPKS